MRLVFISDLHASLRLPYAKVDADGTSSDRLRDVIDIIDQVADFASKQSTKVYIVGDLFDRQHPDAPTLIATSAALRRLAAVSEVSILPGNHDSIGRDGKMYSLQLFDELKTERIDVLGYGCSRLDRLDVFAVPWVPNARAAKRIAALKQDVRPNVPAILLIHQDIVGSKWDSGMVSDDGIDPKTTTDGWSHVFSGHYHVRQEFGSSGHYCGSPLDLRFGDEQVSKRGFYWIDDANPAKLNFYPTRYPRFQTARIRVEESSDIPTGFFQNDGVEYLRVILGGPRELLDGFDERKFAKPSVRYFRIELKPDPEKVDKRIDVDPSLTVEEMCRRYVSATNGDDKELLDLGLKFLETK